jgi:hypothetical protein
MRPVPTLALALLLLAAACRKSEPATEPPAPAPTAAAQEPSPPQAPAPAAVPAQAPQAEPAPAAEARPVEPAGPVEARVEAAPAAAARAPAGPEPGEGAIYRWEDAQGVVHFSQASDIPAARRASARAVKTGLSEVAAEPVTVVPSAPDATTAVIAPAEPAPKAGPGEQPELDENGLPIPGTMKETAHTRAVKAASGGVGPDPAAVERRREEDNRRMKCRVVDGVTICG